MFIGSAARMTGLSVKAIRFYESAGLIPSPPRAGRYRHYDARSIELLLLIKEARALGVTIAGLKGLVQQADGPLDWGTVVAFLQQQKARVQADIQALQTQLQRIDACLGLIAECPDVSPLPVSASSIAC
ncbi:MAG: MerR family transcriptional regulator [Gammaproteobacteria bacterium]|nr:MerR family transcriptional regulator [Gammaproteobacteria bacterium]